MITPSPKAAALALERDFRPAGEGRYLFDVPRLADLRFDLDRLRRDRGALHGELTVEWADGGLYAGNVNVSTIRDRKDLAAMLVARSHEAEIDWLALVEDLCQRRLAAERTGKPAVMLRDLPRPEPGEDLEVDGIRLLRRHPLVLFGDGGDAKSYLALYRH